MRFPSHAAVSGTVPWCWEHSGARSAPAQLPHEPQSRWESSRNTLWQHADLEQGVGSYPSPKAVSSSEASPGHSKGTKPVPFSVCSVRSLFLKAGALWKFRVNKRHWPALQQPLLRPADVLVTRRAWLAREALRNRGANTEANRICPPLCSKWVSSSLQL